MKHELTPLTLAEMLAYLNGELSPEATAAMDARLAAHPEDVAALEALVLELEVGKTSPDAIAEQESQFLAALENLEDDAPVRSRHDDPAAQAAEIAPAKTGRRLRTWWPIAAAIAILAVPAFLLLPRSISPETAFKTYFEPYENVVNVRASTPMDPRIRRGFEAYDASLFEEAAAQFEARLAEDSTDLYANLYGGISLLAIGDTEAAIPLLGYVGNGNNSLQQAGKWYLSLAILRSGDKSLAEKHLDELARSKGKYPDLARALLEDI